MISLKTMRQRLVAATGVVALNIILTGATFGQTLTPKDWTGANTGGFGNTWFSGGNWMPSATPNLTNAVTIDAAAPPNGQPVVAPEGTPPVFAAQAGQIIIGTTNTAQLSIQNGGVLTVESLPAAATEFNGNALIGQHGMVTVSGTGSNWTLVPNVNTLTGARAGDLFIGSGGPTPSSGILNVASGGSVNAADVNVGSAGGSAGSIRGLGVLAGPGELTTMNGGLVSASGALRIGGGGGENGITPGFGTRGKVTVMAGGSLTAGSIGIGLQDSPDAELNILGGTVTSRGAILAGGGINTGMGVIAGATAKILVNGGSLAGASTFSLGQNGSATLTVQNGGIVNAPGGIFVSTIGLFDNSGQLKSATGTVNIGAPPDETPVAPGTINTPLINLQDGVRGLPGFVGNPGTLNFNHTSSGYIFAPMIASVGVVNVLAGTTILTANNDYGGGTNIKGGTLVAGPTSVVDGEHISNALGTGNVSVLGGTLRTTSFIPADTVPGVSTGKAEHIDVAGNYKQGSSGTLALGIAGTGHTEMDHVEAKGSLTLGGTIAVSSLNGFRPISGDSFRLLSTTLGGSSLTGEFSSIKDTLNNDPTLLRLDIYASNSFAIAYLKKPNGEGGDGSENIVTPDPLPPGPGPIPPSLLLAILNPSAEQLSAMFQIPFSNGFAQRLNLNDRMMQIRQGSTGFVSPIAPAPPPAPVGKEEVGKKEVVPPALVPTPTNRWGVWINGWGNFVSLSDDNGVKGYDFTTGGGTLGIDYRITDCLAIGVFGSGAHTWTDLKPGSVDVNTGLGGIYGTYWNSGFYFNGAVYAGYNSYDTRRSTLLRGLFANGSTEGYEISTWITTGYDFKFNNLSIGPTFTAQYVNAHIDGFREHGSFLPLDIHSDSEESWVTDLGFQAQYRWHVGNITVIPSLYAAWEHQYKVSRLPITFGAAELPGATATTFSPNIGQDSCIIDAGANVQWSPRISTYIGYHGQIGAKNYEANGVSGTFSFSF